MTCLKFTPPASRTVLALLTLPQPLTSQALRELEQALTENLAMLERGPSGTVGEIAREQAPGRHSAADAEYASWMPDPCAIEVASWAAHLPSVVRRAPAGPAGNAKLLPR